MMETLTAALGYVAGLAIIAGLFFFPWFTIARKTRAFAGIGYVVASYVLGATLWCMCLLTVWDAWGGFWAFVGVAVLGVGVLPMTLVIFGMAGQWALFVEILLIAAIALSVRLLGFWLVGKAKANNSVILPENG